MKYEPVIGLEVHIHSKTKSKMFCGCSAEYFGADPNTHTCPVCLGLPGAMPTANKKAIEHCLRMALALNCEINVNSKFDRKNYFYPDLPKGYQISQYDIPFGENGHITVSLGESEKRIRIRRVHQEEDTGKSVHSQDVTLLDYNKSGVPLIEAVTEADLNSVEEVSQFAKRLRQIVRYLNVSDADMEKGQMRFELNISFREVGSKELPDYKVEVKNIASISVLERVIESEMTRQTELLEAGETPAQETRGLVDMSGGTVSQRSKESEADYRYFPEPDIPLIQLEGSYIEELRKSIPELPYEKKKRYMEELRLSDENAEVLVSEKEKYELFESASSDVSSELASEIAKWLVGDYTKLVNEHGESDKFTPAHLRELAELVLAKKITGNSAQEVLEKSFDSGKMPSEIVKDEGMEVVSDSSAISEVAEKVIAAHPDVVEDYKKNPNAIMFLVGQVMREMKGQADAGVVREELERLVPGR